MRNQNDAKGFHENTPNSRTHQITCIPRVTTLATRDLFIHLLRPYPPVGGWGEEIPHVALPEVGL